MSADVPRTCGSCGAGWAGVGNGQAACGGAKCSKQGQVQQAGQCMDCTGRQAGGLERCACDAMKQHGGRSLSCEWQQSVGIHTCYSGQHGRPSSRAASYAAAFTNQSSAPEPQAVEAAVCRLSAASSLSASLYHPSPPCQPMLIAQSPPAPSSVCAERGRRLPQHQAARGGCAGPQLPDPVLRELQAAGRGGVGGWGACVRCWCCVALGRRPVPSQLQWLSVPGHARALNACCTLPSRSRLPALPTACCFLLLHAGHGPDHRQAALPGAQVADAD